MSRTPHPTPPFDAEYVSSCGVGVQPGGERAPQRPQHAVAIVHDLRVREPQHGVPPQTQLGVESLRGHHAKSDAQAGFELMNRAQTDPDAASYVRRGLLARGYDSIIGSGVEQPDGSRTTYYVALFNDSFATHQNDTNFFRS